MWAYAIRNTLTAGGVVGLAKYSGASRSLWHLDFNEQGY